MCLAEFAATYVVKYSKSDESECDALPAAESDSTSTQITLTGGFWEDEQMQRTGCD